MGGVRAAQLITLQALALGAHVAVQTSQPGAWEPFLRAISLPSDAIVLVPAGQRFRLADAAAFTPQLAVTDTGPAPDEGPWRTTLVVRDHLDDGDVLSRADLVLLQPLSPGEAALAGAALGLGEAQEWLARIDSDLVAVVNRQAVRFARLAATLWELQLVGNPKRVTVP